MQRRPTAVSGLDPLACGASALAHAHVAHQSSAGDDRPVRAVRDSQLSALPGLSGQGRGVVGLGRRGAPLPRLLPGLGLQPAGPLPAAGRRGRPRAGRASSSTCPTPGTWRPRGVCPGAFRAVVPAASASSATAAPRPTRRRSSWPGPTGMRTGRYKIVTMEGGFHGRTYAALTATAQPKYHAGFEPMVPGFATSLQRSRGCRQGSRRPDGRGAGRADPGRGGDQHPRARTTCPVCASSATSAACC